MFAKRTDLNSLALALNWGEQREKQLETLIWVFAFQSNLLVRLNALPLRLWFYADLVSPFLTKFSGKKKKPLWAPLSAPEYTFRGRESISLASFLTSSHFFYILALKHKSSVLSLTSVCVCVSVIHQPPPPPAALLLCTRPNSSQLHWNRDLSCTLYTEQNNRESVCGT